MTLVNIFATATLLAGLVINEDLLENKVYPTSENPKVPKKLEFKRKLRKDPSLAFFAYYAGANSMVKAAVCSQITEKEERETVHRFSLAQRGQ